MNLFEEFTLIVGMLAIMFEGVSHLRAYVARLRAKFTQRM